MAAGIERFYCRYNKLTVSSILRLPVKFKLLFDLLSGFFGVLESFGVVFTTLYTGSSADPVGGAAGTGFIGTTGGVSSNDSFFLLIEARGAGCGREPSDFRCTAGESGLGAGLGAKRGGVCLLSLSKTAGDMLRGSGLGAGVGVSVALSIMAVPGELFLDNGFGCSGGAAFGLVGTFGGTFPPPAATFCSGASSVVV